MAGVKNTMQFIEKAMKTVNKRYEMKSNNITDIICNSRNQFDLVSNGFFFGYMQGIKASKVENTKASKAEKAGVEQK